jgi:hypothetical protein
MSIKYTNILHCKTPPNLDFWFENIPSGNPDLNCFTLHLHVDNTLLKVRTSLKQIYAIGSDVSGLPNPEPEEIGHP